MKIAKKMRQVTPEEKRLRRIERRAQAKVWGILSGNNTVKKKLNPFLHGLYGLYPNQMNVIAATRGSGKSMIAYKMMLNSVYAKTTPDIKFIDYESSQETFLQKNANLLESVTKCGQAEIKKSLGRLSETI